jgi:hypothetical protein
MVFIRKTEKQEGGFCMAVIMGATEKKGEVGIEIEVEGNKFPKGVSPHYPQGVSPDLIPPQWRYVKDGSLRGQDNAEYIFAKPLMFSDVPKALEDLWAMFKKFGSKLDDSNRTSVHVHLNAQKWHMNRLTAFMALYYCLEEVLTAWCGEHRVGNLFCLRAKDAPAIIRQVRDFITSDGRATVGGNHHYAALNLNALTKHGSIEVRTMRGTQDSETIINWVAILERLYNLSSEYSDPRDICGLFSAAGPMEFFDTLLGDKAYVVRQGISMSEEEIRDSMYEGIRLAQDLCYCRDWDTFKPMEFKPDPFGRKPKKVMSGLQAAIDQYEYVNNAGPVTTNVPGGFISAPIPTHWVPDPEPEYDEDSDIQDILDAVTF